MQWPLKELSLEETTRRATLTPDVHTPTGLFQFGSDGGRDGDFVDVAAGRSPSLQEILSPVARTIARLPPVGDEFPRYLERVIVV